MKYFIITYFIKKHDKDLTSLFKGLSSFTPSLKCLDNVWLIGTEDEVAAIHTRIKPFFDDENDLFLILEVKKNYYGWMPATTWEWIEENIK